MDDNDRPFSSSRNSGISRFLEHVFSNTPEGKADMWNTMQYATLAVLPIMGLNRGIQYLVPDNNSGKGAFELLFEILVQLIVMFIGLILIHRIITYIPTYSGFRYEPFACTNIVLVVLLFLMSIRSRISTKTNLLAEKVERAWYQHTGRDDVNPADTRGNKSSHTTATHDSANSFSGTDGGSGDDTSRFFGASPPAAEKPAFHVLPYVR